MNKRLARPVLLALLCLTASSAFAFCGPPLEQNHWGKPVDYRDPKESYKKNIVEKFHFTPEIESLQHGLNGPLPGDIHYTLIQLVNHHRALAAMANWQFKNKDHARTAADEWFPADCYFERALAFTPDDPLIWMIWGNYVFRMKDYDRAVQIYTRAEELAPDDPEVEYNLGLLNVELKNYDKAVSYAREAYSKGFPLQGLRNKLARAGIKLGEIKPAATTSSTAPATDTVVQAKGDALAPASGASAEPAQPSTPPQ